MGSSLSRVLSSIRAIFNLAISEYALDIKNPFIGMYFDKSIGVSGRLQIPIENIRNIQKECKKYNDELRWLIALISDTGVSLAEAAGLLKSDLELKNDALHIQLKPHPRRPLKILAAQTRLIPLAAASLWPAQRHLKIVPLHLPDATKQILPMLTQAVLL